MAGNTRFHSKHHAEQHHAVRTSNNSGFPDAASDPIASPAVPYQGYFHVNGVLNVDNKLKTDPQYPNFQGELPAIDYNYFADAMLIDNSLSATGDVLIEGNLTVRENLYVDKNVYLSGGDAGVLNFGDAIGDKVKFNAHISSDFIPTTTKTFNLGTTAKRWHTIYGHKIDLDGEFLIGANGDCLFKASIPDDHVLIGTCSTPDTNTKLHVKGGHTELETSLRVSNTSVLDDDVNINADLYMRNEDQIVFGPGSAGNNIVGRSNELKLNSNTQLSVEAPVLNLDTPTIDVSTQNVQILFDEIKAGPSDTECVLHMQSTIERIGIGTCDPTSRVHIAGGTTISGSTLDVTATAMAVSNSTTTVNSTEITTTATATNSMFGKNIVIQGTDSTGTRPVFIQGNIIRMDATTRVDMNIPEINLAGQKTHISLKNVNDALKIDGDTVVVDAANDRVAINRTLPQATLHVGGDTIFDDSVEMKSGDFSVGTGTTQLRSTTSTVIESPDVHITGTDEIELNTPLIDINSGVIDLSTQSTTVRVDNSAPSSVNFVSASNIAGLPGSSLIGQLASVSSSSPSVAILSIDGKNDRVGIGTSDPDKTLTVQGEVSVTGDLTEVISDDVDIDSSTTSIEATTNVVIDTPDIRLLDNTHITLKVDVDSLNIDNNTISVDSFNNRVGFGTSTPEKTVHVEGDVKTNGATVDIDTTGDITVNGPDIILTGTDTVQIMQGDLGIDTATPSAKLNVYVPTQTAALNNFAASVDSAGMLITHDFAADTYTPGIFWSTDNNHADKPKAGIFTFQDGVDGTSIFLGTSSNYATGLTNYVKIDPTGKVGIGTTDVTHDLTVSGDMIVDELEVTDLTVSNIEVTSLDADRIVYKSPTTNLLETNDALYCNANTGQVGINTTTPDAASSLHVHDGDIRITNNFKTLVLDSNFDLSNALITTTTTTGSVIRGSLGEHLVLDLLNDDYGDSIAFRHSSNNSGVVDTVGFIYKPSDTGVGVGIGVNQNELGTYTLAVGGSTNIKGDLLVDGNFLIQGASAQLDIKSLEITDKNVVVNKGGTTQNSINAGLIIFGGLSAGDDNEVGYVKVDENDNSLLVAKAPTGDQLTLDVNNDVTFKLESSLNVTGTSTINQDVTTTSDVLHNSLQLTSRLVNNIDIELVRADLDQVIADRAATQAELDVTQTGSGLSATGEYIIAGGSSYITQATSLHHADQTLDIALKTEETARVNDVADLQHELDTTQTGAGLNAAGEYVVNTTASYISNASSLNNADVKLDLKMRELDNIIGHGTTPNSNTNHLTRLNNLDNHVIRLDGRIDDTNTDVAAVSASLDTRVDKAVAANRIVSTNTNKQMTNTDLIGWISGTGSQIDVTDDGVGGVVLSLPQGNFVDDSDITIGDMSLTSLSGFATGRMTYVDNTGTINTVNSLDAWIAGTNNQVIVTDDNDGTITLSLPQNVHTSADVEFNKLELNMSQDRFVHTTTGGELQATRLIDHAYSGNDGIVVYRSDAPTGYWATTVGDTRDYGDALVNGFIQNYGVQSNGNNIGLIVMDSDLVDKYVDTSLKGTQHHVSVLDEWEHEPTGEKVYTMRFTNLDSSDYFKNDLPWMIEYYNYLFHKQGPTNSREWMVTKRKPSMQLWNQLFALREYQAVERMKVSPTGIMVENSGSVAGTLRMEIRGGYFPGSNITSRWYDDSAVEYMHIGFDSAGTINHSETNTGDSISATVSRVSTGVYNITYPDIEHAYALPRDVGPAVGDQPDDIPRTHFYTDSTGRNFREYRIWVSLSSSDTNTTSTRVDAKLYYYLYEIFDPSDNSQDQYIGYHNKPIDTDINLLVSPTKVPGRLDNNVPESSWTWTQLNPNRNHGITVAHGNTSDQVSITNSTTPTNSSTGSAASDHRKVIQDIHVDEFGHVTKMTSKDVSYALATKSSPGLVPAQTSHSNSSSMFLNADNEWVTYPNVTEKVTSLHDDLIITTTTANDTLSADISNTLQIGTTDTSQNSALNGKGSGVVSIVGGDDTAFDALQITRTNPRILLSDSRSNKDQYIQNVSGTLKIGSNYGTDGSSAAVEIGHGADGNVKFNGNVAVDGLVTGRSTGPAFKGDLEGNASTSTIFANNKTINIAGDATGTVTTDFSDTVNINITVNKTQDDSVTLGTMTTGAFLTAVTAGTNINVGAAPTDDGGSQQISVIDSPTFTKVTAGVFDTTSDARLKRNITNITDDPLDKIKQLQGVSFEWENRDGVNYGMIANDVEKVIPQAVSTNHQDIKAIDYNAVIAHLVEAVKTLSDKVDQLSQ